MRVKLFSPLILWPSLTGSHSLSICLELAEAGVHLVPRTREKCSAPTTPGPLVVTRTPPAGCFHCCSETLEGSTRKTRRLMPEALHVGPHLSRISIQIIWIKLGKCFSFFIRHCLLQTHTSCTLESVFSAGLKVLVLAARSAMNNPSDPLVDGDSGITARLRNTSAPADQVRAADKAAAE